MSPDGNSTLIAFGADHCDRFASFCMNVVKQPQALIMILLPLLKPQAFNDETRCSCYESFDIILGAL